MSKQDLIALRLNSLNSEEPDITLAGIDPADVSLQDKDAYKSTKKVQQLFTDPTSGQFNDKEFDKFYDAAVKDLNTMQTNSFESQAFNPDYFWESPYSKGQKIVKTPYKYFDAKDNPFINRQIALGRTLGTTSLNKWSDRTRTESELAQGLKVLDGDTKQELDYTPEDTSLTNGFGFLSEPLVLATYNEDVKDKDGNIIHNKGEIYYDENGLPRYETLKGRSLANKKVLSRWDTLTKENSFWNKVDFMDSDGIDKSITGTIAKTAVQLAPMLIGPIAPWYVGAYVAKNALDAGVDIARAFGAWTNGYKEGDKSFMNSIEGFLDSTNTGMSEYGANHMISFENIAQMAADSVFQLKGQRWLAEAPIKLTALKAAAQEGYTQKSLAKKFVDLNKVSPAMADQLASMAIHSKHVADIEKAQKLGGILSTAYMAATSASEIADSARDLGIDAKDAAIMYGAYTGVLSFLFKTDLGDWATQNIGLDPIRKLQKEAIKNKAIEYLSALAKGVSQVAKDVTEEMTEEAASKGAMAALKAGVGAGKQVFKGVKNLFNNFEVNTLSQGALGEGLEEVTELTIQKGIENLYNYFNENGVTFTNKGVQYQYDAKELMAEYAATAFGGALGGVVFKGMDLATAPKRPTGKSLADLVTYGYADDIINTVRKMEHKGELPGSTDLSAVLYKDSDGNTEEGIFQKADGSNPNQQSFIANKIIDTVKILEGIREANGIDPIQTTIAEKQKFLGKIADLRTQSSMADDLEEVVNKIYQLSLEERQLLANPIASKDDKKSQEKEGNPIENVLQLLAETKDPNEIEFKNKLEKTRKELKEARKEYARITSNESMDDYFREALFSMNEDLMEKLKTINIDTFSKNITGMSYAELLKQMEVNPNLAEKKAEVLQAYETYQTSDAYKKDLRATRDQFEEANTQMSGLVEQFQVYEASLRNLDALKEKQLAGNAVTLNPDLKIPDSELGKGEEGVKADDRFLAISNKAYADLQGIDNSTNEYFPYFAKIQSDRVASAYMRKVLDTTEEQANKITASDGTTKINKLENLLGGNSPIFDVFFGNGNSNTMQAIFQGLKTVNDPTKGLEERAASLAEIGKLISKLNINKAASEVQEFTQLLGDGLDIETNKINIANIAEKQSWEIEELDNDVAAIIDNGIAFSEAMFNKIPGEATEGTLKYNIGKWIEDKKLTRDSKIEELKQYIYDESYKQESIPVFLDEVFDKISYNLDDLSLANDDIIAKAIEREGIAKSREVFNKYNESTGFRFTDYSDKYKNIVKEFDNLSEDDRKDIIKTGLNDFYSGQAASQYFDAVDFLVQLKPAIDGFNEVVSFKKQMDTKFKESAKSPLTEQLSPIYKFLEAQYETISKQGAVEYANASEDLKNSFKEVEKTLDLAEAMLIAMVRINPMVNAFRDAHQDWVVDELKGVRALTIGENTEQAERAVDTMQAEIDALRFESRYYKDLNEFNLSNTIRYLKKAFKVNSRLKAKALLDLPKFLKEDLAGLDETRAILNQIIEYPGIIELANAPDTNQLTDEKEAAFNAELGKAETVLHNALISDLAKITDDKKVEEIINAILPTQINSEDSFTKVTDDLENYSNSDKMLYYARILLGRTADVDFDLMRIKDGDITAFDDYNFAPLQGQIDAAEFSYIGAFADPRIFKLISKKLSDNSEELTFETDVNTTGITGPAGSGKTSASLFLRNRMVLEGAKRQTSEDHSIVYMAAKETQYKALHDNLNSYLLGHTHKSSGTTDKFLYEAFGINIDDLINIGLEQIKAKKTDDLSKEDLGHLEDLCNKTANYRSVIENFLVTQGVLKKVGGAIIINEDNGAYAHLDGVKSIVIDEATHNDARVLVAIDIIISAINKKRTEEKTPKLPIDIVYSQDDLQMGSTLPVINTKFTSDRMYFLANKRLPVAVRSEWNTINETLASLQVLHENVVKLKSDEKFQESAASLINDNIIQLKMAESSSGMKGYIGFKKTSEGDIKGEISKYILSGFLGNPIINGENSKLLYIVDTDEAKELAREQLKELLKEDLSRYNDITFVTAEEAMQSASFLSPVQAQSQQANYVIIDAKPVSTSGAYGAKRSLEFLYTMLSRTRTACLLVDKGSDSLSGLQLNNQQVDKALSIIKFTETTKNRFKDFEIARLEAKRKLYEESGIEASKAPAPKGLSGTTGSSVEPVQPPGGGNPPPTNPPSGSSGTTPPSGSPTNPNGGKPTGKTLKTDEQKLDEIKLKLKDKSIDQFANIIQSLPKEDQLTSFMADAKKLNDGVIPTLLVKDLLDSDEINTIIALYDSLESDYIKQVLYDWLESKKKALSAKEEAEKKERDELLALEKEEAEKLEKEIKALLNILKGINVHKIPQKKIPPTAVTKPQSANVTKFTEGGKTKRITPKQPIRQTDVDKYITQGMSSEEAKLKIIAFRNRIFNDLNFEDKFRISLVKGSGMGPTIPNNLKGSDLFKNFGTGFDNNATYWIVEAYDGNEWITILSNPINNTNSGTNTLAEFENSGVSFNKSREFDFITFANMFSPIANEVQSGQDTGKSADDKIKIPYNEFKAMFDGFVSDPLIFNSNEIEDLLAQEDDNLTEAFRKFKGRPFVFYAATGNLLKDYSSEQLFKLWLAVQKAGPTLGYSNHIFTKDDTSGYSKYFTKTITIDGVDIPFEAFSLRPIPLANSYLEPSEFFERLKTQMVDYKDDSANSKGLALNRLTSKYSVSELYRLLYAITVNLKNNPSSAVANNLKGVEFNKLKALLSQPTTNIPFFELNTNKLQGENVLDVIINYLDETITEEVKKTVDADGKDSLTNINYKLSPKLLHLTPLLFHDVLYDGLLKLINNALDPNSEFAQEFPLITARFSHGLLYNTPVDKRGQFITNANMTQNDLANAQISLGDIFNRKMVFELSTNIPNLLGVAPTGEPVIEEHPDVERFNERVTKGNNYALGKQATMVDNGLGNAPSFYVIADIQDVIDGKASQTGEHISVTLNQMSDEKRVITDQAVKEDLYKYGYIYKSRSGPAFSVYSITDPTKTLFNVYEKMDGSGYETEADIQARQDALDALKFEEEKLINMPLIEAYNKSLIPYRLNELDGWLIDKAAIIDLGSLNGAITNIKSRNLVFPTKSMTPTWKTLLKNPLTTLSASGNVVTFKSDTHEGFINFATGEVGRADPLIVNRKGKTKPVVNYKAKATEYASILSSFDNLITTFAYPFIKVHVQAISTTIDNVQDETTLQQFKDLVDRVNSFYTNVASFINSYDVTELSVVEADNRIQAKAGSDADPIIYTGTIDTGTGEIILNQYERHVSRILESLQGVNSDFVTSVIDDEGIDFLLDTSVSDETAFEALQKAGELFDFKNNKC